MSCAQTHGAGDEEHSHGGSRLVTCENTTRCKGAKLSVLMSVCLYVCTWVCRYVPECTCECLPVCDHMHACGSVYCVSTCLYV